MHNLNILFIDNFDSFTFNLVHYCEAFDAQVHVVRNDEIPFDEVMNYDGVLLSPGPGLPSESGELMKLIEQVKNTMPILGVCLGMQALAESSGARLKNLDRVLHGLQGTALRENNSMLLDGISNEFHVGHYHSWVVDETSLSDEWIVTSRSKDKEVMSMEHRFLRLNAVQFHPESILTPDGKTMIKNWLNSLNKST
jgi:anthranilate synthase component II